MQTKMRIAMLDLTVLCLAVASTVGAADGVLMDPNTKDYPCWRGPYGSGAAPDCGKPLVASFSDAKQLWISEEDLPHTFEAPPSCFESNFSSPLIHRGRIYCWASVPGSKSVVDVVCIDLASGKVLGSAPAAGSETCTSIVGSDGVAITGHRGDLAMFAFDGREFKRLGDPLLVKWESYTTPALSDGRLYIRLPGELACNDLVKP